MRRSQAPSLRTTIKPVSNPVVKDKPIEKKFEPENNLVRSTDDILNLVLFGSDSIGDDQIPDDVGTNESFKENKTTGNAQPEKSVIKSYNVVYGKPTTKKHKTWEDNGVLDVYQDKVVLKDEMGKSIGTVQLSKCKQIEEGSRMFIGGKEVELIDLVDPNTLNVKEQPKPTLKINLPCTTKSFKRVSPVLNENTNDECDFNEEDAKDSNDQAFNPTVNFQSSDTENIKKIFNVVFGKQSKKKHKTWEENGTLELYEKFATLKDEAGKKIGSVPISKSKPLDEGSRIFVGSKEVELIELINEPILKKPKLESNPCKEPIKIIRKIENKKKLMNPSLRNPLHKNFDGLILPEPNAEHQWYFNKENLPVTPVFIDSSISRKLRQHQQIGVTFLYQCVMGFKENNLTGAILADEMGLGKTLQCIALVWTLLKRGPYGNKPVIKRVLIVTPSSLTMNWYNEFIKWLGRERLVPYVVDQNKKPSGLNNCPVMIISYEMFVRCHEAVQKYKFDLLICDEGHRLKNSSIRTTQLLNQLDCDKRILLTGTPIQNDLQEFYALVDFVNPNALGSSLEFRKTFEEPILASRQPNADEEILSKGEEAAQELNRRTSLFLLRRTKEILDKYLPSKHEIVVFCKPTEIQRNVYNSVIDSLLTAKEDLKGLCDGVAHLGVISTLRKICNHPGLLRKEDEDEFKEESITGKVLNEFPEINGQMSSEGSGKLALVVNFLRELRETKPKERVVLVSNSTQALNVIGETLDSLQFTSCRLDGSTPASQRSSIVDRFNSFGSNIFVFLLSAKAGGVGLNLTGASRLILFDSDWNPATDLQSMSRIWRDGQKHSVYIYRFLTTGTIEEKIYQRQITKQGLCDGIVDPQSFRSIKLSREELKELFMPCEIFDDCYTHYSLSCSCLRNGEIPVGIIETEERSCQIGKQSSSSGLKISELFHWEHHGVPINSDILSELSLKYSEDLITFIFRNSTN